MKRLCMIEGHDVARGDDLRSGLDTSKWASQAFCWAVICLSCPDLEPFIEQLACNACKNSQPLPLTLQEAKSVYCH